MFLFFSFFFPSSHVWMSELHYKESWALKRWCFWTVVLEKTLESPLDSKEIQPKVHPEGNQSWIFTGRTNAEAETPILWPPDAKSWLIWIDPDAGKDWRQEQKGKTGWDGWMASLTRWTWGWVSSGRWWWTGRPGMLWFMGLQWVGHDWATELNWRLICETEFSHILPTLALGWRWERLNTEMVISSVQSLSCIWLFVTPMNHSTPGLPVHHQLPEFTQTHVHRVSDAIQPSHPVFPFSSCPQFLPASESFPMSQLFAWGGQSTGVSALESFLPRTPRTDLL